MGAVQAPARVKGAAGPWSSVTPMRAAMAQVSKGREGELNIFLDEMIACPFKWTVRHGGR